MNDIGYKVYTPQERALNILTTIIENIHSNNEVGILNWLDKNKNKGAIIRMHKLRSRMVVDALEGNRDRELCDHIISKSNKLIAKLYQKGL